MTIGWDDVNARVAGWRLHLLGRAALEQLAREPDLAALARALATLGYPLGPAARETAPGLLERAARAVAGERLTALARWCGPRTEVLALLFDDEDRRSIRALVRGAAEGAAAGRRLAGCLPTPALPLRVLETLADQSRIPAIGAALAAWRHPFAPAVLAAGAAAEPDLLAFELELARRYAARALGGARRDRGLLGAVRLAIDLDNLLAAVLLAGARSGLEPGAVFLEGGRSVTRPIFLEVAAAETRTEAAQRLTRLLADRELARLARGLATATGEFTRSALALRIRRARDEARRDPLGPAPVVAYVLCVRQELLALQRMIWSHALRAGLTDPGELAA
ncbi:MAG TPA: V-type ATPase subunit [Gemmatimonadales bacterium]|nr:V-type ATPase subunit [Gemmatimonadales bacterium]